MRFERVMDKWLRRQTLDSRYLNSKHLTSLNGFDQISELCLLLYFAYSSLHTL